MGSQLSNMVQLALKTLVLMSLGQYFVMGCPPSGPPYNQPTWKVVPFPPENPPTDWKKYRETLYQRRGLDPDFIRKIFIEFDANKDGRLSYKECHDKRQIGKPESKLRRIFAKSDKNEDDFLDFFEFSELVKAYLD